MIQTVNALSHVDLAANKLSSPLLNDVLYTDSDGQETTYVAVAGQWRPLRGGLRTVATASLPAAGASMNGTILLENAGAGTQNLILYASGERHRISGGAAF